MRRKKSTNVGDLKIIVEFKEYAKCFTSSNVGDFSKYKGGMIDFIFKHQHMSLGKKWSLYDNYEPIGANWTSKIVSHFTLSIGMFAFGEFSCLAKGFSNPFLNTWEFVQSDWFLPVFIPHDIDTARGALGMFHVHAPGPGTPLDHKRNPIFQFAKQFTA